MVSCRRPPQRAVLLSAICCLVKNKISFPQHSNNFNRTFDEIGRIFFKTCLLKSAYRLAFELYYEITEGVISRNKGRYHVETNARAGL